MNTTRKFLAWLVEMTLGFGPIYLVFVLPGTSDFAILGKMGLVVGAWVLLYLLVVKIGWECLGKWVETW